MVPFSRMCKKGGFVKGEEISIIGVVRAPQS